MTDYVCIECRTNPIVVGIDDRYGKWSSFFCVECGPVVEERRRVQDLSFAAWWDEFVA